MEGGKTYEPRYNYCVYLVYTTPLSACGSFVFALINYKIPGFISVEQLSCLVGSTFVSAAFGSVYIYTAELAPTSHRGKIMGICHLGSQIGTVLFDGMNSKLLFNFKFL